MSTKPNIENIDYCIELMRNAKNLDMSEWRAYHQGDLCHSVEDINECGTAACFGGYVAASEKFQEDGGSACDETGCPSFGILDGYGAVAKWLNINEELSFALCFIAIEDRQFYGCERKDVTPKMVIEKLEMIKAGEL